eukprot:jgi/Mesen1/5952/ME000301S05071
MRSRCCRDQNVRLKKALTYIFCICFFIYSAGLVSGYSEPHRGQASASLLKLEEDPLGDLDTFAGLSEADKKKWSQKDHVGVSAKIKALRELETSIVVEIKLVGFDGDGNFGITLREYEVLKYLGALKMDKHVHVLHGEEHELLVDSKISFDVTKASSQLTTKIASAIAGHLAATGTARPPPAAGQLAAVPYSVVDAVLEAQAGGRHEEDDHYTLFVLNLPKATEPYAYSYGDGRHDCLGTFHSGKDRYMWIDLTAGPVSYGPAVHGHGLVTNASFVQVSKAQPLGVLTAHLVTMAAHAVAHVASPAMYHYPIPFAKHAEVRLIVLRSGGDGEGRGQQGIDLASIEKELTSKIREQSILLPHQELSFATSHLSFSRCAFCAAAYSRSLRTHAGKTLDEGKGMQVQTYLDSEQLHHLLRSFWPEIKTAAEIQDAHSMELEATDSWRMIPIFLLDLDSIETILLDRTDQAVAYDDMVLAVRTKGPKYASEFTCNGEAVQLDPTDVTRPALAALLQTGWGITPPYMTWSKLHSRIEDDYRWAVGKTPFGPFSTSRELSLLVFDSARRNILYTLLNETLGDALHTLEAIKSYGGEDVVLHSRRARSDYTRRWNVLLHKLRRGSAALRGHDFAVGLFFLRSARHDSTALFDNVRGSASELHTTFSCFKESPTQWLWYLALLATAFGVIFLFLKRETVLGMKSKSKRF